MSASQAASLHLAEVAEVATADSIPGASL